MFNVALGYSKWISKTFVTGVPAAVNQVRIGATLADTMANLLANLNANDLDGVATFTASGTNGFYVNLRLAATWSFNNMTDPGSTITTLSTETITVLEPEVLPDLVYKDISIRVYDTYVNERILVQELASVNACSLEWNAGDDLYKQIMASNCVFNMLVPNIEDAYFIHLFSGDEQRYRVEVVGVDELENEMLIWKGFLLPDQYSEPYKNGNLFVSFTASDMLSSMKGKYLEPWFYENTVPIAEVFAYCLAATGLQQNIIVKPSIVPANEFYTWEGIGVPMQTFIKDDKYEDCYSIIDSLLVSNGLTITNFRGYWWLEGVHRKKDVTSTNIQFDVQGYRVADIITVKPIVDCIGSLQPTPNFTAVTPWKRVNVDFEPITTKNLFTENVVRIPKSKQFYSIYKAVGYPYATPVVLDKYAVVKMKNWIQNLNNQFEVPDGFVDFSTEYFAEKFSVLYWTRIPSFSLPYNFTEAMVMNLYVECPEKPYVKPGNLYEFEVDFTVDISYLDFSLETFKEKIIDGYYDKLVPFQIFINDQEKYSNRPSFSSDTNLRYVAQYQSGRTSADHKISFKLKFNFYADIEGFLKVRFLMPINRQSTVGIEDFSIYRVICNELKLTLVEDYDENLNTIASRLINYTQELDYKIDVSSTIDNSVVNSFSLGYPISNDYFKTIDRSVDNSDYTGHHYFLPDVDLELLYNTFTVPSSIIKYLFEEKKLKTLFLEKPNGDRSSMSDFWYVNNNTETKLGFLKSYDGFPVIPKKYKKYPDVNTEDLLKYMEVKYAEQDYSQRLRWKLYGSDVVNTFPKTLSKALHGVQSEMIYRLEATALELLFPDNLIDFYFDNQDRNFIPTTLKLDLFNGKTSFVATEAKFTELTDISYE